MSLRWPVDKWHTLFRMLFRPDHVAFFPHKVFRWDVQGIYRDCFYPFPCTHFLGGEIILGQSVRDVLPKKAGKKVQNALEYAVSQGLPQQAECRFSVGKQAYVVSIRLFPYDSEVLGFVTDYDSSGKPVIHVTPDHPSLRFLNSLSDISATTASLKRHSTSRS